MSPNPKLQECYPGNLISKAYRGTSLIRNSSPPEGFHVALGKVLL